MGPVYFDILEDGVLGVGDTILIRGMDRTFQGCKLSLIWKAGLHGVSGFAFDVDLPPNFQDLE